MFSKSLWAEERPIPRHLPVEAQGIYAKIFRFQAECEVTQIPYSPERALGIAFAMIDRSMAICISQIVLYLRADRSKFFCFIYTIGMWAG